MPDREKVINAIECCIDGCLCAECDYEGIEGCWNKVLLTDALALLKEQEDLGTELTNAVELIHKKNERIEKLLKEQEKPVPVQVLFVTPYKSSGIKHARCPGCDSFINSISNAVCCGRCGQVVKWE